MNCRQGQLWEAPTFTDQMTQTWLEGLTQDFLLTARTVKIRRRTVKIPLNQDWSLDKS